MKLPNKSLTAKKKTKSGFFSKLSDKINAQNQTLLEEQTHQEVVVDESSIPPTTEQEIVKQEQVVAKKTKTKKPSKQSHGFLATLAIRAKNAGLDFFAGIIKEFSRITWMKSIWSLYGIVIVILGIMAVIFFVVTTVIGLI